MPSRQRPVPGLPFAGFVSETATKQRPVGGVLVAETAIPPPALDSAHTDATSNGVTSQDLTMTVGMGPNPGLLASVTLQKTGVSGLTVTWDNGGTNQPMTLLGSTSDASNGGTVYLYGLVAPTSGAKTLHAAWTGTSDVVLAGISFINVSQIGGAASFANFTSTIGTSNPAAVTQTALAGNLAVCAWETDGSWGTPSPSSWYVENGPNHFSSTGAYGTSTSSTVSFSVASASVAWAAASVQVVGLPVSARGIAAGTGAAAGVGASQTVAASAGAAAGTGGSNVVGASTAASVGAAAGVGGSNVVGAGVIAGVGASAGAGDAAGVGASTGGGIGASAGTGAASGVGAATDAATGSAAGIGAASGVGASTAASSGAATGAGDAAGIGAETGAGVGASSGVGAASAVGASIFAAVGSASGSGHAAGIGVGISAAVGAASGTGAADGVGHASGDTPPPPPPPSDEEFVQPSVNIPGSIHIGPPGEPQAPFPIAFDATADSTQAPQLTSAVGDVGISGRSAQRDHITEAECAMTLNASVRSAVSHKLSAYGHVSLRARGESLQPGATTHATGVVEMIRKIVEISDEVPTYAGGTMAYDEDLVSDLEDVE